MSSIDFLSMFMLGFLGTGHCVGMCGPLVLALPTQTGGLRSHLLYHFGRITTYMMIGAILGAVGASFEMGKDFDVQNGVPALVMIQVGFAWFAAGLMLIFGLARLAVIGEPSWMASASPTKVPGFSRALKSILGNRNPLRMLPVGLMMGLLPCGLSYAAFARAIPSGGWLGGLILTGLFGLGTLPGLLLVGTAASRIARRYRKQSDIISGLLMIAMSISLFLQALGEFGCCSH
jgi:sulfite exporter TauE/SafE